MRINQYISQRMKAILTLTLLLIPGLIIFFIFYQGYGSSVDDESQSFQSSPDFFQTTPPPPPSIWDRMVYPTDQRELLTWEKPGVYQPTSSGKIESALYGSVRTIKRRGRLTSSFHEGLDIAALERDRYNRPVDKIYSIADGKVAYINRIAGNSTYGRYVVITHEDALGPVYTLYSHLAKIEAGLKEGEEIPAGAVLGLMGHSGLQKIPKYRAHLHFEVGVIYNKRFRHWALGRKLKNPHGTYHGWNLEGIDPLKFFQELNSNDHFNFQSHLESIPRAFDIIVAVRALPDYFRRYPLLWNGPDFSEGEIVIGCSENGIPLFGREAFRSESEALGRKRHLIRNVNREVLGKNGCHLIDYRRDNWELAQSGKRWLSILLF